MQDVRICRRILGQFGEIGRIHFATEGKFDKQQCGSASFRNGGVS